MPPAIMRFLVTVILVAAARGNTRMQPPPPRVGDAWGTNIHWTSEPVPGEAAMLAKAYKVRHKQAARRAGARKQAGFEEGAQTDRR